MNFIDTHTHLYIDSFDNDRDEVIQKAIDAGIEKFFLPAIKTSYFDKMNQIKNEYPKNIFLMTGLHPCYVDENYQNELKIIKDSFSKEKFCAIGEIGIDLYWEKKFLKQQQNAFEYQIEFALKNDLPIIIHCRNSFNEVFEVLNNYKSQRLRGIFHCFSGNFSQAQKVLSLNLKLGIGGIVTFKNGGLDKFLHMIPIENIVLETDSPYLSPHPFRGKRNESSNLILVAKKIAEIYSIDISEVAKRTTKNANEVFDF